MKKVILIFADIQNMLEYVADFSLANVEIDFAEQSLTGMLDPQQILIARIQYEAYVQELVGAWCTTKPPVHW